VRHIAIDGKTLRRSHDREAGLGPLDVVSAWASETGLALGQLATDEKSNEITAIPELIGQIDVKKAIVTIDAMGCQREIAQKIVAEKGDYMLAVNDNQPKLHEEIHAFFSEQLEDDCASVECRRARERHLADNLAWLRRMTIGLLKQYSSNHSIKGKQQMAG
jgi:predicted transposase YbfD/YdcC